MNMEQELAALGRRLDARMGLADAADPDASSAPASQVLDLAERVGRLERRAPDLDDSRGDFDWLRERVAALAKSLSDLAIRVGRLEGKAEGEPPGDGRPGIPDWLEPGKSVRVKATGKAGRVEGVIRYNLGFPDCSAAVRLVDDGTLQSFSHRELEPWTPRTGEWVKAMARPGVGRVSGRRERDGELFLIEYPDGHRYGFIPAGEMEPAPGPPVDAGCVIPAWLGRGKWVRVKATGNVYRVRKARASGESGPFAWLETDRGHRIGSFGAIELEPADAPACRDRDPGDAATDADAAALARRILAAVGGSRRRGAGDDRAWIERRYRALRAAGVGYGEAFDRAREEWAASVLAEWAESRGRCDPCDDDGPDGEKDRRDIDGPPPCPSCPAGTLATREGLSECDRCGYFSLAGDDGPARVGEVS